MERVGNAGTSFEYSKDVPAALQQNLRKLTLEFLLLKKLYSLLTFFLTYYFLVAIELLV